jgi:mRNA interferase MazF
LLCVPESVVIVAVRAPQRGDVWLVDLGMTAKVRPALVLSIPADDADRALVTLVPHTTSVRGSRFEAAVRAGFLKAGAFDAQSLITIPHAKLLRVLGRRDAPQLALVEVAVRTWLGLGSSEV